MSNEFEDNLRILRIEKVNMIRDLGFSADNTRASGVDILPLLERFKDTTLEELETLNYPTAIRGRLMINRLQGKSGFGKIKQNGNLMQFYIRRDEVGGEMFDMYKLLDLGDHIAINGTLMRTKAGELTVRVQELIFLTKAFLPMPDKMNGQQDVELSLRQRYVDLFTDDQVRNVFVTRSKIIKTIRNLLDQDGFMEVETPMLHPIVGGATAKPFSTHHNALDMDLSLRIAPELYLKRLIIGGFDKVYELNRNFRNEGIDTTHNPEFTTIEFYQAYTDYYDMMYFVQEMITRMVKNITGSAQVEYNGMILDFEDWFVINFIPAITIYTPFSGDELLLKTDNELVELFETYVEPNLIRPTVILDFPSSVSPLARKKTGDSRFAQRFEMYVAGMEVANAFSELCDPIIQEKNFQQQVQNRTDGASVDNDYIRALSYGMPPTSGCGIGIDRLVMLLTNSTSIRDVILFPTLRKQV